MRSLSCRTASSRLNALEMKTRSERHSREKVVVRDQKRNVRRPRLQKPENCPSTSWVSARVAVKYRARRGNRILLLSSSSLFSLLSSSLFSSYPKLDLAPYRKRTKHPFPNMRFLHTLMSVHLSAGSTLFPLKHEKSARPKLVHTTCDLYTNIRKEKKRTREDSQEEFSIKRRMNLSPTINDQANQLGSASQC